MNDRPKSRQDNVPAGLCARCRHARDVTSARGSRFVLCGWSAVEPQYPRYPPLPVIACRAYTPRESDDAPDSG